MKERLHFFYELVYIVRIIYYGGALVLREKYKVENIFQEKSDILFSLSPPQHLLKKIKKKKICIFFPSFNEEGVRCIYIFK